MFDIYCNTEPSEGNLGYQAAHKLTSTYNLPAFSKISVKRLAQLISHSVVTGINSHVAMGCLPT